MSQTQEKIIQEMEKEGRGKRSYKFTIKECRYKDYCRGKAKETKWSKTTRIGKKTTTRNGDKIYRLFKSIDTNLLKLGNKTVLLFNFKKGTLD